VTYTSTHCTFTSHTDYFRIDRQTPTKFTRESPLTFSRAPALLGFGGRKLYLEIPRQSQCLGLGREPQQLYVEEKNERIKRHVYLIFDQSKTITIPVSYVIGDPQWETPKILRLAKSFSTDLIMKSATSAYGMLKPKRGKCPSSPRDTPCVGRGRKFGWPDDRPVESALFQHIFHRRRIRDDAREKHSSKDVRRRDDRVFE